MKEVLVNLYDILLRQGRSITRKDSSLQVIPVLEYERVADEECLGRGCPGQRCHGKYTPRVTNEFLREFFLVAEHSVEQKSPGRPGIRVRTWS